MKILRFLINAYAAVPPKKFFGGIAIMGLCCMMLGACGIGADTQDKQADYTDSQQPSYENSREPIGNEENETKAVSILDTLTTEQKVGQLFIVRPDALDPTKGTDDIIDSKAPGAVKLTDGMAEMLNKYHIGGICQFGKNIKSANQIIKFNEAFREISEIPLFIAVDEEGGAVARLANNSAFNLPKYESAAAVAASGDTEAVNDMAQTIGNYLTKYGFNLDFAPVADVNTNPDNPIIGTRAFSSDAKVAAAMTAASARGFRETGILPTLKHFPGHGDTGEDSHTALAVTYKTLEELAACEFLPFASDSGMHAVMVGHIAVPNITGTDLPATFSPDIINLIPNKENTLIITDALEMQAITDAWSSDEAALRAFKAGCDMLLMPVDIQAAYDAILNAVNSGEISEDRLNESVYKILLYKLTFIEW